MVTNEHLKDSILHAVPNRIVITGGPLAGKSTLIEYLEGAYESKCRFMKEVATMLLSSGYPKPGGDVQFSDEWLDYVNRVILPTQLNMENGHLHAAAENHKRAMVFDRGLLDPAAYIPGGTQVLHDKYGLDVQLALDRYTMVIHLQSLACISKDEYNRLCGTNPSRYDTAEQAIERDQALVEAWSGHSNWHFISAEGGIESVIEKALALISPLLDIEIEKKYLMTSFPEYARSFPSARIVQHYVHTSGSSEIRVRFTEPATYEIAMKSSCGLKRTEWEQRIPQGIYQTLASDPDSKSIEKRRYYVPFGRNLLEIDEYENIPGLFTLECEFETEKDAEAFVLPHWAIDAGAVDVTGNKAYSNANLARPKKVEAK
jgi:CYTH domain-containing protein/predicted ATPase